MSNMLGVVGGGTGKMELIEFFQEDDATGSSQVFTLNKNLYDDYAYLIVIGKGQTNGSMNLELKIDGLTTGYRIDTLIQDNTTLTGSEANSQAHWVIIPSAILDIASRVFWFVANISVSTNDVPETRALIQCHSGAMEEGQAWISGDNAVTDATISDLTIETSTSTWEKNAQFAVYGVKR